ncbi:MAG: DUF4340 domain-containing protein [Candidatus Delongbacteria bacterium]|nr:DUF4340 domain-containing protein [Candidatus Delongbacteria bacterium]MBN2835062.1 DUF4340 domain-containing protein [Candidatus Delongbacteria bacterium]
MKKFILPIIVLLVLAILAIYLSSKPVKTTDEVDNNFFRVDTSKVASIEIIEKDKSITLKRDNGEWNISSPINYSADKNGVKSALDKLASIRVDNVISNNVAKQKKFEVEDSTGILLKITTNDGKNSEFYIGKSSEDYGRSYYRMKNSNDIYVGNNTSKYVFSKDVNKWRNKIIIENNKDDITGFSIEKAGQTYLFAKDSTEWNIDVAGKTTKADKPKVDKVLNYFAKFNCKDFNDSLDAETISPDILVKLNNTQLMLKKESDSKFWAVVAGNKQVYEISKANYDAFDSEFSAK